MKSVLGLVFTYLIVCLVGTTAGAVCYMLYKGCTLFVAGTTIKALSATMFIQGLQLVFPIILLVSPLFLALYRVRHSENRTVLLITYCILSVITWGLLLRVSIVFLRSYTPRTYITSSLPSTGYFRGDNNDVTFYTVLSQQYPVTASGVTVRLTGVPKGENSVTPFKDIPLQINDEEEFKEPLINALLEMPGIFARVLALFSVLRNTAYVTFSEGIIQWLYFISIGFALSCMYGLIRISSWKLLDAFAVIIGSSCIYIINSMYYVSTRFNDGNLQVNAWFDSLIRFKIPTIVIINVAIGIICIATGIVCSLLRRTSE